jgi:multicomponent Na+:H+ antiporter subunit D
VAVLVLAGSLLAVIYVWRVVEVAYFRPPPEGQGPVAEAPAAMLVPTWVLIAANFYFGIDTNLTVGVAGRAAANLIGGAG